MIILEAVDVCSISKLVLGLVVINGLHVLQNDRLSDSMPLNQFSLHCKTETFTPTGRGDLLQVCCVITISVGKYI